METIQIYAIYDQGKHACLLLLYWQHRTHGGDEGPFVSTTERGLIPMKVDVTLHMLCILPLA